MNILLVGKVLWSYDYEINEIKNDIPLLMGLSGAGALHKHEGTIQLYKNSLEIDGDLDLKIEFSQIEELYLGFDEIFTPFLTKNLGLFWKPLRITFSSFNFKTDTVYLIIDFDMLLSKNQKWFNLLKELLS